MKILLVDDDALVREGLEIIINMEEDFEVIATASDGKMALEQCHIHHPDLVLMDIRMPGTDGVLGTMLIKQYDPNIKVVILTTFKDDDYIKEAVRYGASGYMLKNQSAQQLIDGLRAISKGHVVFEREVASVLSHLLQEPETAHVQKVNHPPGHDTLSERELHILRLVADGLSNREIAAQVFLSEGTVRNYITNLLDKLQLRDRTQLAIYYLKSGMLDH